VGKKLNTGRGRRRRCALAKFVKMPGGRQSESVSRGGAPIVCRFQGTNGCRGEKAAAQRGGRGGNLGSNHAKRPGEPGPQNLEEASNGALMPGLTGRKREAGGFAGKGRRRQAGSY